jgi:hypothetical protein
MTISSGCWSGTGGMAWADDANASAKATAVNLIMLLSPKLMVRTPETLEASAQPQR